MINVHPCICIFVYLWLVCLCICVFVFVHFYDISKPIHYAWAKHKRQAAIGPETSSLGFKGRGSKLWPQLSCSSDGHCQVTVSMINLTFYHWPAKVRGLKQTTASRWKCFSSQFPIYNVPESSYVWVRSNVFTSSWCLCLVFLSSFSSAKSGRAAVWVRASVAATLLDLATTTSSSPTVEGVTTCEHMSSPNWSDIFLYHPSICIPVF